MSWQGGAAPPPSGATPVVVSGGHASTGVNAVLAAAGSISGTVTSAAGATGLEAVAVAVFNGSGTLVDSGATSADGTYSVKGLQTSSPGYTVCFDASNAVGGASTTGYTSECYQDQPWNSYSSPPAGTNPVAVTAGTVTSGIDAALPTGGAIAGTVKASDGTNLSNVSVEVYTTSSVQVGQASTSNGKYTATALPGSASGYVVCFNAGGASGTDLAAGYTSLCYKTAAWSPGSPVPSGATLVPVSSGTTKSGINAALPVSAGPAAPGGPATLPVGPTSPAKRLRGLPGAEAHAASVGRHAAAAASGSCDPDDLPGHSEGPDDDGDECTFTVVGYHLFTYGGADRATTPSNATCDATKEGEYLDYAYEVITYLADNGYVNAASFLEHWITGKGSPDIQGDGSYLSGLAKASSAFQNYDQQIQDYTKGQWNSGNQDVVLPGPNTISWGNLGAMFSDPELFFSFGGTQAIQINGSATNNRGNYVGNITYRILDTYGWNDLPTGIPFFNDFRPDMNYLQTHCGANGAFHWFESGVVVTVPIS